MLSLQRESRAGRVGISSFVRDLAHRELLYGKGKGLGSIPRTRGKKVR